MCNATSGNNGQCVEVRVAGARPKPCSALSWRQSAAGNRLCHLFAALMRPHFNTGDLHLPTSPAPLQCNRENGRSDACEFLGNRTELATANPALKLFMGESLVQTVASTSGQPGRVWQCSGRTGALHLP